MLSLFIITAIVTYSLCYVSGQADRKMGMK
jgi:hypothetical protein